ncbi:MBL fold metallo-hydrolase [Methanobacterium ferruginis]|uniref:MBL fold metallo-hydrolase n=1 Tax=Methanobacterium ferruginis TaxID=710191 RepID=UPI0025734392|nr:MBL fold metallo-hydrolase [Methanobacterium ferruginis]BDZ67071.1 MBL fold metallo-hydrolase [Methanobacterium ferruginis]
MPPEIRTIKLKMFAGLASVNCYLIKINANFVLIDTGTSGNRGEIENQLEKAGCKPGNLNLILITHGDSDHAGNAAYLRDKYGTKIAMHQGDSGMVQKGDMLWNRKGNPISKIMKPFMGLSKSNRFTPDFYVEDGYDLTNYGLNAQVIHIPGHSLGSLGILTDQGDLFCGDLLINTDKPVLNSIMDDKKAANLSIEKLEKLNIVNVYPGHGEPFPWDFLTEVKEQRVEE